MAGAPLSGAAGDKDALQVGRLRGPLLDDYYGSELQKRDVMAIAEEIKRRHLAKLPSDTGNLRSTAQVRARRSAHRDRRWEAEYSVGGPRADYIVPLEDEHHYLDSVLREMGFYTGDIVNGPTGKIPERDKAPQATVRDVAEAKPPVEVASRKLRAGLYEVTGGGKTYHVEHRLDIPGQPWWSTDQDAFFDQHRGAFRTRGDAVDSMRQIIEQEGD